MFPNEFFDPDATPTDIFCHYYPFIKEFIKDFLKGFYTRLMETDTPHQLVYSELLNISHEFIYRGYLDPIVKHQFEITPEFSKQMEQMRKFFEERLNSLSVDAKKYGSIQWIQRQIPDFFTLLPEYLTEYYKLLDSNDFGNSWPPEIQYQMQIILEKFHYIPFLVMLMRDIIIFLMFLEKKRLSSIYEIKCWDFFIGNYFNYPGMAFYEDIFNVINQAEKVDPEKTQQLMEKISKRIKGFEKLEESIITDKVEELIEDKYRHWESHFNDFLQNKLEDWNEPNQNALNFGIFCADIAYDYVKNLVIIYRAQEPQPNLTGYTLYVYGTKSITEIHEYFNILDNIYGDLKNLLDISHIPFNQLSLSIKHVEQWIKTNIQPLQVHPYQDKLNQGLILTASPINKYFTSQELDQLRLKLIFLNARLAQLIIHHEFGQGLISKMLKAESDPKGPKTLLKKLQ